MLYSRGNIIVVTVWLIVETNVLCSEWFSCGRFGFEPVSLIFAANKLDATFLSAKDHIDMIKSCIKPILAKANCFEFIKLNFKKKYVVNP